jgi:hypothetical protein
LPNDQLRDAGSRAWEWNENVIPAFPGAACSAAVWSRNPPTRKTPDEPA